MWIAKFPSKTDTIDKDAREWLAYKLVLQCTVLMPESRIEKVAQEIGISRAEQEMMHAAFRY